MVGRLPWIGATFTLELRSIPASALSVPAILLGASRTGWGPLRLPFDLGVIGMPGCQLLVSPDVTVPLANRGGRACWSMPLPNNAFLVGRTFYVQALVTDPRANPLGVTMANGGAALVGAR